MGSQDQHGWDSDGVINERVQFLAAQTLPTITERNGVQAARNIGAAISAGHYRIMQDENDHAWYNIEIQDTAGDWVEILGVRAATLGL